MEIFPFSETRLYLHSFRTPIACEGAPHAFGEPLLWLASRAPHTGRCACSPSAFAAACAGALGRSLGRGLRRSLHSFVNRGLGLPTGLQHGLLRRARFWMFHDAPVYGIFVRRPIGHGIRDLKGGRKPPASLVTELVSEVCFPAKTQKLHLAFMGGDPNASAGVWDPDHPPVVSAKDRTPALSSVRSKTPAVCCRRRATA